MRYTVDKAQRDFFQKEGSIELEGLLTSDQLVAFNQAIDQALSVRCAVPLPKLSLLTPEHQFMSGRDLWRESDDLRKLVTHSRLTDVVVDLIDQRPLRLGYDQLFPACSLRPTDNLYTQYLEKHGSLAEISYIDGLLCGLMIPLTKPIRHLPTSDIVPIGADVFSCQPGNIVFFLPSLSLSLERLLRHTGQRYLMIVFAQTNATYIMQTRDPQIHYLKRLDYRFGDRLNDKYHLILAR